MEQHRKHFFLSLDLLMKTFSKSAKFSFVHFTMTSKGHNSKQSKTETHLFLQ